MLHLWEKKGHYAKQCKSKKRILKKLLQMIHQIDFDYDYYGWTTNLAKAVLTLEEENETEESLNDELSSIKEEPVMMMKPPLSVNLTMQPSSYFRPYIKVILKPTEEKQVALTTLIDTGAVDSIILEACVPRHCYVPTQVAFTTARGENFYSNRYTRPIELQPFGLRHGFFVFDHSGEDMILGTDFLSLIAPFAFFSEGFFYTIHNPMDGKPHIFQVPWVEK